MTEEQAKCIAEQIKTNVEIGLSKAEGVRKVSYEIQKLAIDEMLRDLEPPEPGQPNYHTRLALAHIGCMMSRAIDLDNEEIARLN